MRRSTDQTVSVVLNQIDTLILTKRPIERSGITGPGLALLTLEEPEQAKARAIRQLKTLGYEVNLTPAVA